MADIELHADSDRDGHVSLRDHEHRVRAVWPGAIIVANLDCDDRVLPGAVQQGEPVVLDRDRPTKSPRDDELAAIVVKVRDPAALTGRDFFLRIAGWNASYTRLYDDRGRPVPRGPFARYDVALTAAGARFQLEARTLAATPVQHARGVPATIVPTARDESDLTVDLMSNNADGTITKWDSLLFTTAPFIVASDTAPLERVYVLDSEEVLRAMVRDIEREVQGAGVQVVPVPQNLLVGERELRSHFVCGYCDRPGRHNRVLALLGGYWALGADDESTTTRLVQSHFPSKDLGLFGDFFERTVHIPLAPQAPTDGGPPLTVEDLTLHVGFKASFGLYFRMYDAVRLLDYVLDIFYLFAVDDPPAVVPTTFAAIVNALGDWVLGASAILGLWEKATKDVESWREYFKTHHDNLASQYRRVNDSISSLGTMIAIRADDIEVPARLRAAGKRPPGEEPPVETDKKENLLMTSAQADALWDRLNELHSGVSTACNMLTSPPLVGAPFGKIVLAGSPDPELLDFLQRQYVQPVVLLSTGPVAMTADEVVSFVPAQREASSQFVILRNSPRAGTVILRHAANAYRKGLPEDHEHFGVPLAFRTIEKRRTTDGGTPVTALFRGQSWFQQLSIIASERTREEAERTGSKFEWPLKDEGLRVGPNFEWPPRLFMKLAELNRVRVAPLRPFPELLIDFSFNANTKGSALASWMTVLELLLLDNGNNVALEDAAFAGVDAQLEANFPDVPVVRIPAFFDSPNVPPMPSPSRGKLMPTSSHRALVPNLLANVPVNGRVLLPQPLGPRMQRGAAIAVLENAFAELRDYESASVVKRHLASKKLAGFHYWAHSTEELSITAKWVASQFFDGFPGDDLRGIEKKIMRANTAAFDAKGALLAGWQRVLVPEQTIDLFEAYVEIALRKYGVDVRWIDDWHNHRHGGNVRRATNVLPRPHAPPVAWWKHRAGT